MASKRRALVLNTGVLDERERVISQQVGPGMMERWMQKREWRSCVALKPLLWFWSRVVVCAWCTESQPGSAITTKGCWAGAWAKGG